MTRSKSNPLTLPLGEVKGLTSQEWTCVKKRECKVTIEIHPMYAGDPKTGVRDRLKAMCSRYNKQLGGIPIAFEKVWLSSTGALLGTSPYIHTCIEGTFYIFSPEKGAVLEGIVKKSSPSHLNCLVHKIFNVSVPRPQEVSSQDWEGSSVGEGDVVKVAVTNVDMSFFLPIITGCLKSVVSRKPVIAVVSDEDISAAGTSQARKIFTDSGISSSDGEGEEVKPLVTEKKKKKKRKNSDLMDDCGLTDSKKEEKLKEEGEGLSSDLLGLEKPRKRKKKKKEDLSFGEFPDSSFKIESEGTLDDVVEEKPKKKKKKSSLSFGDEMAEFMDSSFKIEREETLDDVVEEKPKKKKKKSSLSFGDSITVSPDLSFKLESEGTPLAEEKPKKKKKKSSLSFGENITDFPDSSFKLESDETPVDLVETEKLKKKKKKDVTMSEAETDALFLSSLMAKEKTPVKASKKRKAEESPLSSKKKKKKKVED